MKNILLIAITFLAHGITQSQDYTIPTTPLLTHLYNSNGNIGNITNTENLKLLPLNLGFSDFHFVLIKKENGLFALVNGTGKVFKAIDLKNNKITFKRIDSTLYFGNNFNSIKFSYKNKIHSLGGYGFWRKNGQLTYFEEGLEWFIVKLKKEFEWSNYLFNYQVKEAKIYSIIRYLPNQDIDSEEIKTPYVVEFNIKNNEQNKLGSISSQIDITKISFTIDIPSLKGLLIASQSGYLLLNFTDNKVYKLINKNIINILESKVGSSIQNAFEYNGSIYFNKYPYSELINIKLKKSDFEEEPYPVYIYITKDNLLIPFIYLLLIIITIITIVFFIKKYYKKYTNNQIRNLNFTEDTSKSLISSETDFSHFEVTFVLKIIKKSERGEFYTVSEINEALGIKNKSIEIQKRVRTEFINRVNYKFNKKFNINTTLIQRERSNDDARFINYGINNENAYLFNNHMKNNII